MTFKTDAVRDVLPGFGFLLAVVLASVILVNLLGRWPSHTGWLLPQLRSEKIAWVGVAIAAGVCEEIGYRGYLQRQFWTLTGSLPVAILLQAVLFGAAHIYQGWRPALVTALYALGFGLFAAWRRSIVPGMVGHSLMDILGGLSR